MSAGTSKELGDFRVSVFPQGAEIQTRKEAQIQKQVDILWRSLTGHRTLSGVVARGADSGEPPLRQRQWKLPLPNIRNRGVYVSDPLPIANTANETQQKGKGYMDTQ